MICEASPPANFQCHAGCEPSDVIAHKNELEYSSKFHKIRENKVESFMSGGNRQDGKHTLKYLLFNVWCKITHTPHWIWNSHRR